MPVVNGWRMDSVDPEDLSATDLLDECFAAKKEYTEIQCYSLVKVDEPLAPFYAQMVFFLDYDRAGIAWGGDAHWTDCSSAEEAVQRWTTGEMSN